MRHNFNETPKEKGKPKPMYELIKQEPLTYEILS